MTVDDLRAVLDNLPGYLPVILPADAEGNGHSPAAQATIGYYMPTSTYEGERYDLDDPVPVNAHKALFIEPTC